MSDIWEIGINCHRCKRALSGSDSVGYSRGFYHTGPGDPWRKFARSPDELIVCDQCMESDPKFQKRVAEGIL